MKFSIPGTPKALERARRVSSGGKSWWYDPSRKIKDHIALLAIEARNRQYRKERMDGYLMACMTFYCEHLLRIDVDNAAKLILDALNNVIYEDDAYVIKLIASKEPCEKGKEKTEVEIYPIRI